MEYEVVKVEPLEGHTLRTTFSDGVVTEADFSEELWGPMFEPLRDLAYFRQVKVDPESHTIVWPNGLDPAPEVLHGDFLAAPPSKLKVRRVLEKKL